MGELKAENIEMKLKVPKGTKGISIVSLVETQLGYEMITKTIPTAFIEDGYEITMKYREHKQV